MKLTLSLFLAATLAACGSKPAPTTTPTATAAAATAGLRIAVTTIYVDDQDKALRFYTDVLGFTKKDDESNGDYRWLTVTSPAAPNGTELLLAKNTDPAAKAYQEALFAQSQPAVMFYTDDIQRDAARIKAKGGELTMEPTEVMPGSTIATAKDGCGNLIQLTQLDR